LKTVGPRGLYFKYILLRGFIQYKIINMF
jgi:hypothetical protein